MLSRVVLGIAVSVLASVVLAAPKAQKHTANNDVDDKQQGPALRQRTADYRADNEFALFASPISVFLGPLGGFGVGLSGEYFLNDRQAIEVSILPGGKSCLSETCQYVYNFASVRSRYFVGNSLNFNVGVMRRSIIQHEINDRGLFSDSYGNGRALTAVHYGVVGGIGNFWQFNRFILGAEWAAMFIPISGSSKIYDKSSEEGQLEEARKASAKEIDQTTTLFIPSLILGAAF